MLPGRLRSPRLVAALGLCVLAINVEIIAAERETIEDAIEQCVVADMASIGAPGAAVTVIDRGEIIFNRGFGIKRRG
ncbi:MAG: hypothetical protein V2I67_05425 [Thermoanaerobaculales bacterium]|jgi:CubicO group peptidase (beta-lactamase class C family)|nr:hypothetical protein [Thermoanaerobaculales bacterium]